MSFMSGMVSGFMSTFGAGGGMGAMAGGAGGAAGAADAGGAASAAGASGAADAGAGASAAGSTGAASTGGVSPSGAPSGGENVGSTSSALSTDTGASSTGGSSTSGGSGDIIRQNPYGQDASKSPTFGDYAKKAAEGYQQGSQKDQQQTPGLQQTTAIGNTYGALFGSSMNTAPMGQMAPQSFSPPPMATGGGATLTPPPAQPISPPPQAAPIPMTAPQPGPYPVIQPQLGVSDMRAKRNIIKGNKDLERLLDNVYSNLQKKGKR